MPVLKKKLPDRVKEKKKFELTTLAEEYLRFEIVDTHNATFDVLILQQLMDDKNINVSPEDSKKQAVPLNFQTYKTAQQRKVKSLKPPLLCFFKENQDSSDKTKLLVAFR